MSTSVLALNTGSSSLKFSCYTFTTDFPGGSLLYSGSLSRIGQQNGKFQVSDGQGSQLLPPQTLPLADINAACNQMFDWIKAQPTSYFPSCIGHRIVHGGPHFSNPHLINASLIETLEGLSVYAPEHLPPALKAITFAQQLFPSIPHVACFDTAFHASMPAVAKTYAVPETYRSHGLQKYGFHGLSYQYLMSVLEKESQEQSVSPSLNTVIPSKQRILLAHLGHGASMAAVKHGHCIETTMGFSPTGGFPMSSRSGDLDPEVVLFMLQHEGVPILDMKDTLNKRSGLVAFTSKGDDMRDLLTAEAAGDEEAHFAADYFVYHIVKHIGSLVACLGGLDVLVFSAGIGERSSPIRKRICEKLHYLGCEIDDLANEANLTVISTPTSSIVVRVIPTNEEIVIARLSLDLTHSH